MYAPDRLPEPPLGGSRGDEGIDVLFVLLLVLLVGVGLALYIGAGILFQV